MLKLINSLLLHLLRWQGRLDKAIASLHAGLAMAAEHQGCLELLAEVRDLQMHHLNTHDHFHILLLRHHCMFTDSL